MSYFSHHFAKVRLARDDMGASIDDQRGLPVGDADAKITASRMLMMGGGRVCDGSSILLLVVHWRLLLLPFGIPFGLESL